MVNRNTLGFYILIWHPAIKINSLHSKQCISSKILLDFYTDDQIISEFWQFCFFLSTFHLALLFLFLVHRLGPGSTIWLNEGGNSEHCWLMPDIVSHFICVKIAIGSQQMLPTPNPIMEDSLYFQWTVSLYLSFLKIVFINYYFYYRSKIYP